MARRRKKKPKRRKTSKASDPARIGPRLPADDEGYTLEFARTLLPPGARLNRDTQAGRWQAWFRLVGCPWRSVSRAWTCRSSREALSQVLTEAWRWARADGQVCGIAGLLNEAGGVDLPGIIDAEAR